MNRTNAALSVIASGRWGRRRVRVTECYAVLRAEDAYTTVLRDCGGQATLGRRVTVECSISGRDMTAVCEVRANAIWRGGRLFYRCPRCDRRCTRLYLPLADSRLACRRCWGLTYNARTLANYKDTPWGRGALARMFGTTQRDWAYDATDGRRKSRRAASRRRLAERRGIGKPGIALGGIRRK